MKHSFAQLLIRKLGSFIRLRRVILLRSDIRLTPSDIRYASFMANKISRKPQAFISLSLATISLRRSRTITLAFSADLCYNIISIIGVWALLDAKRCLQRCNTKAKLAIKQNDTFKGVRYE